MYKRSTGNIKYVSDDLHKIIVEIPLSYKNRNYMGTIFGGSLFSATDPIYMIQLIQILGKQFLFGISLQLYIIKDQLRKKPLLYLNLTGPK